MQSSESGTTSTSAVAASVDASTLTARCDRPRRSALLVGAVARQVDVEPVEGDVLRRQPVSPLVTVARLL